MDAKWEHVRVQSVEARSGGKLIKGGYKEK
jgi:hypothetical protein